MKRSIQARAAGLTVAAMFFFGFVGHARADAITDWTGKAGQFIGEAKLGTPPAVRLMAIVQTAVHDAIGSRPNADSDFVDAAVAAANRTVLTKMLPTQQAAIDATYQAALTPFANGAARSAGIAAGERAAAAVLARRADDGAATPESYRPHTTAGSYVPTAGAAGSQWGQRKPWLFASAAQYRPGPPPSLKSDIWTRDYNEVKAIGARNSTQRSAEQTEIGRFWEYSLPAIYLNVVRSVAQAPGRTAQQNARLFAAVAQAMDDALIAVFEAKYHYNFWRPSTAIRNGDIDGNDATERDASWTPLIDAPLHPEYPSGHGILAGAVGAVLKAELGNRPAPEMTTSSPSAKGAVRRWTDVDAFVREVSDSRIYGGIHFRNTMNVSTEMGRRVGELAAAKFLQLPH